MEYKKINLTVEQWLNGLADPRPNDLEREQSLREHMRPRSDWEVSDETYKEYAQVEKRLINQSIKKNMPSFLEMVKGLSAIPRQQQIVWVDKKRVLSELDEGISSRMEELFLDGIKKDNLLVVGATLCAINANKDYKKQVDLQDKPIDVIGIYMEAYKPKPRSLEEQQDNNLGEIARRLGKVLGLKREFKWTFMNSTPIRWNTVLGVYSLRCV